MESFYKPQFSLNIYSNCSDDDLHDHSANLINLEDSARNVTTNSNRLLLFTAKKDTELVDINQDSEPEVDEHVVIDFKTKNQDLSPIVNKQPEPTKDAPLRTSQVANVNMSSLIFEDISRRWVPLNQNNPKIHKAPLKLRQKRIQSAKIKQSQKPKGKQTQGNSQVGKKIRKRQIPILSHREIEEPINIDIKTMEEVVVPDDQPTLTRHRVSTSAISSKRKPVTARAAKRYSLKPEAKPKTEVLVQNNWASQRPQSKDILNSTFSVSPGKKKESLALSNL